MRIEEVTAVLARFRIPTGVGVWIEDVVVAEAGGGQGTGEALVREGANRLYQRLGFERRDTNVYRLERP